MLAAKLDGFRFGTENPCPRSARVQSAVFENADIIASYDTAAFLRFQAERDALFIKPLRLFTRGKYITLGFAFCHAPAGFADIK